ncbi:hypothetical protein BGZ65_002154 [Modicella reniformis]|uniref:Uncharacterized protein n=1 Tax=Modicella reniformis TaxID=1440133 RepID=A0A9P6LS89_9FUNG|nr:hypothetical protein BGZ65_002154 [Modicella reniformis]
MRAQRPRIEHLLKDKQTDLSNFIDELSIAIFKTTLETVNIQDEYFAENRQVTAGVMSDELLETVALGLQDEGRRTGVMGILSQDHIQQIASRLFGTKAGSRTATTDMDPN